MTTSAHIDLSLLPQPFFGVHSEWADLHRFAWERASHHIRVTRGRRHMDVAWDPNRNYQWVWDASFMALYCRYGALQFPGTASLDNFYDRQRTDGYIGMTYDMNTGVEPWPNRINPPLFAWAEWEHYRTTGDPRRLARAARHIAALMGWIDANRRLRPFRNRKSRGSEAADQLYYFEDCGSCGMDDSCRTPRVDQAGQYFDWIDLCSQMALSFEMLSRMHGAAGDRKAQAHWARRARSLGAAINSQLWCERTRFYHDRMLPSNFVASKTAAGFWPLVAGICPARRRDALVGHLQDEREFNRPIPVPSLSADDPNYHPDGTYWLGGVWAPTNYMITRGLQTAGRGDVAHEIAVRYIDGLVRTYRKIRPHTLWENYAPEQDRPGLSAGHRVKPDFVGWSGIGPIAMLIENVLGVDVNGAARTIEWDIRLTEEHGVRQLPVGMTGHADLSCRRRRSPAAPAAVEILSDTDLTLRLRRGKVTRVARVERNRAKRLTV